MDFLYLDTSGGGSVPPQLALCEAILAVGSRLRAVVDDDAIAQFEDAGIHSEPISLPERPTGLPGPATADWIHANRFMGPMFNDALRDAGDVIAPTVSCSTPFSTTLRWRHCARRFLTRMVAGGHRAT